jgi:hypothetical protein
MRYWELFESVAPETAYYDPNEDRMNGKTLGQTRTQKLTLRDLHRLKLMRARDKFEALRRQDLLTAMYGTDTVDDDDEKEPPPFF